MRKRFYVVLIICLATLALATAQISRATLGGLADSVESDRKVLSAVRMSTSSHSQYTVQEIQIETTLVREYVSLSGIVFAVAWNGLVHPDLAQLLGPYNGDYEKALQEAPRKYGRSRLEVKGDGVVVEKWGHMRNLQGRAYAPDLIPPGVSIDEIK
jgi:hypothetical protein